MLTQRWQKFGFAANIPDLESVQKEAELFPVQVHTFMVAA